MSQFVIAREDRLDLRSDEYRDLFGRSAATPFQHPVWLHHLYTVLAPARAAEKRFVTIRQADRRLVGVIPMISRRQFGLRLLEFADLGVNDYAAPVLDRELAATIVADPHVGPAVRAALGPFDLLRVERVRADQDQLAALLGGAKIKRHAYQTHRIALPPTSDAWRKGLRPDFARHLERKYKRLRPKGGHRIRTVTDAAEIEQVLVQLQEFRAARFDERGGTDLAQVADYFAFYRAVALDDDPDRPNRLRVLEVGDDVAAATLDLVDDDQELFLLVGYDVGRLRNYSLGLLIVDQLVIAAIERGRRCFDLTVGDEPYKADFGAVPSPLFELRSARTPAGAIGVLGRDAYLLGRRQAKQARDRWQERQRRRQQQS
ncbi:MAG TPA: GNAT family N-acetyltransferase [Microlunatus sp.]